MRSPARLISEVIAEIAKARVAVIGDVMIDEYLIGDVGRISPEAPVPVVRTRDHRLVAGGAANVAANVMAIGAHANLIGMTGDDGGSAALATAMEAYAGKCDYGLICEPGRRTTRKTRILAHQQQIVRVDVEDDYGIKEATRATIVAHAIEAIRWANVIVLSDYNKGVFDDETLRLLIKVAHDHKKPIVVDPKRRDLSVYLGASILTPNCTELANATNLPLETAEQIEQAAAIARAMFGGDLLLTRSEKGISYFDGKGTTHIEAMTREVFDVSGAGDTLVAVFACALAVGASRIDAARIANHAAGVVVGKTGTARLTHRELADALLAPKAVQGEFGMLVGWEEAARRRASWRELGFTVGLANGCFDLVHPGHTSLIRQAAAACDRLILALNSDESVRRLKGMSRPIQSEAARASVVGAMRGVDLVVLFDEDTPLDLIKVIEPDILIKGSDYTVDRVAGADFVIARGGRVLLTDLIAGQSTTSLLSRANNDQQVNGARRQVSNGDTTGTAISAAVISGATPAIFGQELDGSLSSR